jgi:hypothetical protein
MSYSRVEVERLTAWAAQECDWQQVGPYGVSDLVDAYLYLNELPGVTLKDIQRLGHMVEPGKNSGDSWRTKNVWIGDSSPPRFDQVPRLMDLWWDSSAKWRDPTLAFKEFEEIHPFVDGNGRVGALLFNYWNGTMEPMQLEFPPNLWNDQRREGVEL